MRTSNAFPTAIPVAWPTGPASTVLFCSPNNTALILVYSASQVHLNGLLLLTRGSSCKLQSSRQGLTVLGGVSRESTRIVLRPRRSRERSPRLRTTREEVHIEALGTPRIAASQPWSHCRRQKSHVSLFSDLGSVTSP